MVMANPVPKMDSNPTKSKPIILSSEKLNSEKNPVKAKAVIEGKSKTKENINEDKITEDNPISLDFTVVVLIA